jgi:hypothetical protein
VAQATLPVLPLRTGTTNIARARWGRNSIGIKLDAKYYEIARPGDAAHGADPFASSCLRWL